MNLYQRAKALWRLAEEIESIKGRQEMLSRRMGVVEREYLSLRQSDNEQRALVNGLGERVLWLKRKAQGEDE